MSSFLIQSMRYDAPEVESVILDMESELQDERDARVALDDTAAEKITAATEFYNANVGVLDAQYNRMVTLNDTIRAAVTENMALEKTDAEYMALIASQPYTDMADKIVSLYALSAELTSFLVQTGRRGRPPM